VPSSRQAVELARRHPALRAAVAVHPHDSKDLDAAGLAELAELGRQPEVVAFGEIGLDFHYDHSPRDVQREAFKRQLALAAELALPVVIHEREAVEETMAILDAEGGWARGGEWHCCSTTPELAVSIAKRFFIGIAGWLTFQKSDNIREMARAVPIERMVLETDAPYLAPAPHRGHRCEPAFVAHTLAALAELRAQRPEDLAAWTTRNAVGLFRLTV
jgi:TatD DNase family protein